MYVECKLGCKPHQRWWEKKVYGTELSYYCIVLRVWSNGVTTIDWWFRIIIFDIIQNFISLGYSIGFVHYFVQTNWCNYYQLFIIINIIIIFIIIIIIAVVVIIIIIIIILPLVSMLIFCTTKMSPGGMLPCRFPRKKQKPMHTNRLSTKQNASSYLILTTERRK